MRCFHGHFLNGLTLHDSYSAHFVHHTTEIHRQCLPHPASHSWRVAGRVNTLIPDQLSLRYSEYNIRLLIASELFRTIIKLGKVSLTPKQTSPGNSALSLSQDQTHSLAFTEAATWRILLLWVGFVWSCMALFCSFLILGRPVHAVN